MIDSCFPLRLRGLRKMRVRSVLMLAMDTRVQYRTLRCAARCAESVYVLGAPAAHPLSSSMMCREFFPAPEGFMDDVAVTAERINQICRERDIEWVVPSDFPSTRFLAIAGDLLERCCYPVSAAEALDVLNHKGRFAALCRQLGVPHPRTEVLSGHGAVPRFVSESAHLLPFVCKPASMDGGKGVWLFTRPEEVSLLNRISFTPIIVQSYVEGMELSAFFLCRAGAIVGSVIYRQNDREVCFVAHDAIVNHALRIIRHFRYDGVIGFDICMGRDGRPYFIECNPRFWYHMDVAMLAGVNFVQHGLAAEKQMPSVAAGRTLCKARAGIAALGRPWRLRADDLRVIVYLAKDPAYLLRSAIRKWKGFRWTRQGSLLPPASNALNEAAEAR